VSRVRLSELAEADEAPFLAAVRASRSLHSPWLNAASTPAAFQLLVDRAAGEDFCSLLARRRDTGALVGYLNISNIVRGPFQSAFLGYGAFIGEAAAAI
jgi:ribosomal-protein-alanine N-acetyltransferase